MYLTDADHKFIQNNLGFESALNMGKAKANKSSKGKGGEKQMTEKQKITQLENNWKKIISEYPLFKDIPKLLIRIGQVISLNC